MKSNRLTYLYDGNFFLHKTLHIIGAFDTKEPMFLKGDDEEKQERDKNSLLHKLTMDFSSDIRKAGKMIDEIIITMDDYSWRNEFFEDKEYMYRELLTDIDGNVLNVECEILVKKEDLASTDVEKREQVEQILANKIDYKGHRVKDKAFNWSLVYATFEQFLKELNEISGVKWSRIKGCEGDDIIFAVATYYAAMGKSVMIYSGDNDLKQLIAHNADNNAFIIHHKKTEKKIVMSQNTAKWFQNNDSTIKDLIRDFAHGNDIKLLAESAFDIVFTKILTGDSGDNVGPVILEPRQYGKKSAKAGQWRDVSIGKRVIDKIKEEIDYKKYDFLDFFRDDFISMLAKSVIRNFKPNFEFKTESIKNNILINRDLVFLHKNCIPQSIYESMIEWIEQNYEKNDLNLKEFFSYKQLLEKMPNYTQKEENKASTATFFKHFDL